MPDKFRQNGQCVRCNDGFVVLSPEMSGGLASVLTFVEGGDWEADGKCLHRAIELRLHQPADDRRIHSAR